MQYMFLIYSPESAWTRDEWTACTEKSGAVCQELAAQGRFQAAFTPLLLLSAVVPTPSNRETNSCPQQQSHRTSFSQVVARRL